MARYEGKHRTSTTTGRRIARVALTGAVAAAPFAAAMPAASAAPQSTWDKVAQCEGSGNWKTNTGNGFAGGLQFTPSTWKAYGGTQFASNANQASREQQIAVAERVLQEQGPGAWPVCSKKAGLTKSGGLDNQEVSASASSKGASVHTKKSEKSEKKSDSSQSKSEKKSESKPAPTPHKGSYTVQAGDTLGQIGTKLGKDWHQVFTENKDLLHDPNMIQPGQQLKVG